MPGKSRRKKGKYSFQTKRKKEKLSRPTMLAQPAAAQTHEAVSSPNAPVPSAKVPAPMAKLATVQYPHIGAELLTIGILAGIMLIILIVLSLAHL